MVGLRNYMHDRAMKKGEGIRQTTLTFTDTINRVGYTIIDGVQVVQQHSCVLPLNNPQGMRISMTKMDGGNV